MSSRADSGLPLSFLVGVLAAGHTAGTMAIFVLPAVAPAVAHDYRIDASLIGYQVSLVGCGVFVSLSLLGNLSRRLGACRTYQLGLGLGGTGILIMLLPPAPFLAAGSVVIGMGYGLLTPSSSKLLVRYTPATRRSLVFSVHQLGIPFGGILAALIGPAVAVAAGWRWSGALSAALLYAVIAVMQRGRHEWDEDRESNAPAVSGNPLAGVATIWAERSLRLVSIAGGCFSWAQFCVVSYVVVACVETLGMSLVVAGTVLTVVQASSAVSRVFLGWLVDRAQDTAGILAWNAGVLLLACVAALGMSPALPLLAVYVLFAVLGGATGSWPGTVLAEIGRLAPHGQVSLATSGALVIINIGKLVGPVLFAVVYAASRSYGIAFATLAVPTAVCLACLVAARERKGRHR
ncbi:MAG: MFS transporter [Betaproteobacteria bacterium]|nr:MFS transporter [Betaproteobacteria bacterium]